LGTWRNSNTLLCLPLIVDAGTGCPARSCLVLMWTKAALSNGSAWNLVRSASRTFVLSPVQADRDTIQDFVSANDQFEISAALFGGGLVAGALPASQFVINATGLAGDANDRFIYNNTNGELFFDSNGTGAGGSSLIATLVGIPGLASSDFTIV